MLVVTWPNTKPGRHQVLDDSRIRPARLLVSRRGGLPRQKLKVAVDLVNGHGRDLARFNASHRRRARDLHSQKVADEHVF